MKVRILFLIILTVLAALACGLFSACGNTHVHNFEIVSVQTEPTCTEDGWGLYCCDCGEETEKEIPALDHDWDEWSEIHATCEDDGVKTRVCKRNAEHTEEEIIPALDHDWGDWSLIFSATCDEVGVWMRACERNARHTEHKYTSALEHDWSDWKAGKIPSCTEDGWEQKVCRNNSTHVSEKRVLPATGHEYGDWVTVTRPRCFTAGVEKSTCIHGDDTITRKLEAGAHSYVDGVCAICGRRDWTTAQIDDPDLYNSEYAFRALALEKKGASLQELYSLIAMHAREYHCGVGNSDVLGKYDYAEMGLTFEEAATVWKAFMDDHPLYYWLGRTLQYGETLVVQIDTEYTNPDIRIKYNQTIYEVANNWREDTEELAYLAALSYHDKIIYAIDYAYLADGRTPQTAIWAHNIVGVFTGQGAVCEGYARTFQLMLNMTGIENIFVTGTLNGAPHAWNLVKLDNGQWYWFDLTNDDVPGWLWGVKYNYFAVNDTQNVNWVDSSATYGSLVTFPDKHIPDSGTGAQYMPPLPARSNGEYSGIGELRLRQTFDVGKFTYAIVGYRAVQLIKCTAVGEIFIPEYVEYGGASYEVISIGSMKENGLFYYMGKTVFKGALKTLHIPCTVRYLFETALSDDYDSNEGFSVVAYDVDNDNQYFTTVDGVLFTKNMYTLVAYPGKSPRTEYYIPDNVECIAVAAFPYRCSNLRSLTIGSGLAAAGNTNWGYGWLQDERIGSHNFIVGTWASMFSYLEALEEIKVAEDNPYFSAENGMLFNKDKTQLIAVFSNLTEVVVPSSVTVVKYNAFFYNRRLTRLVFEGDALQLIEHAFGDNCYLDEIVFGGTREQWDAIEKEGYKERPWDDLVGVNTPDGTYTLICLGDL